MADSPNPLPRKDRSLTQEGFSLLLARLGSDPENAARRYEELRRGLITFFAFRNLEDPAALADETFNRAAHSLSEGKEILAEDPAAYLYAIARNIWLAAVTRGPQTLPYPEEDSAFEHRQAPSPEDLLTAIEIRIESEQQLSCLDRCLNELPLEERNLILRYYQGTAGDKIANRQLLAEQLGLQPPALRKRASRLRTKLADCLRACLSTPHPE